MADGWKGPYQDQWKCRECGKVYVVATLARCCEDKHKKEDK